GDELPKRFTSVTATEPTDWVLPWTVNGRVNVNWLPKGVAAALPYHCLKSVSSATLSWVVCKLEPAAPVHWNIACVSSRELAYPVMTTVNPVALRVAVTLEMTGAVGLIRIVRAGAGDGVMSDENAESRATIAMFPATVPVCTPTSVAP